MSNRELKSLQSGIGKEVKDQSYLVRIKTESRFVALKWFLIRGFIVNQKTFRFLDNPAKGYCCYLIIGSDRAVARFNHRKPDWLVLTIENAGCLRPLVKSS